MDSDIKVSYAYDLKFCQKCEQLFTSHDIIPLCPDCRYKEAGYHL